MGLGAVAPALLILWFLVGHPLALYADTLDEFDASGGADELTRKTRTGSATPLPDPLGAPDEESPRLYDTDWILGRVEGLAALGQALQVRSTVILKRLSGTQRPPLLFPLQVAPPSSRDGEPPHAA